MCPIIVFWSIYCQTKSMSLVDETLQLQQMDAQRAYGAMELGV